MKSFTDDETGEKLELVCKDGLLDIGEYVVLKRIPVSKSELETIVENIPHERHPQTAYIQGFRKAIEVGKKAWEQRFGFSREEDSFIIDEQKKFAGIK